MSELTSFRSVVELWETREAMALDVPGARNWNITKWWQRDSIPSEWWSAVLSTDKARENGVTADLLARLAARECLKVRA